MEAKVDVRKLQVLNDRINQTIDALNQVRLSVHGLGHSGMQQGMNPFTQGFGLQQPFGFGGFGSQQGLLGLQGFGGPQGIQGFPGLQQSVFPGIPPTYGLQHNPFVPYLQNPFVNPLASLYSTPWNVGSSTGSSWGGYGGIGTQGMGGIGGLYHSGPELIERQLIEARAADPFRITQTFPFVVS